MEPKDINDKFEKKLFDAMFPEFIKEFRPSQEKSLNSGLLDNNSILVCTPTASGKTLIAEMAAINAIQQDGKALYIVPLKALASEKHKEFTKKYNKLIRVGMSVGDPDKKESRLHDKDLIILTSEKLDSLLRHGLPWLNDIRTIIIDEIHLLNDNSRGPTLEIIITLLRTMLKDLQIIGLSATIGNPSELANWLDAKLVIDEWRPVRLQHGIYLNGSLSFDG